MRNARCSPSAMRSAIATTTTPSPGPYIVSPKAPTALVASVAITLMVLAMFGYVKGHFTGAPPWRSAMQSVLIGGVAAGGAFVIARAISGCERTSHAGREVTVAGAV